MRKQSSDLRRTFSVVLARLLEQRFPGSLRVVARPGISDRHIPGISARLIVEHAGKTVLCLGAANHRARETTREMVATGLIWLADFNSRRSKKHASELWYCFADSVSEAVKQRLASLSAEHLGARLRLVELKDDCADGITKPKSRRRQLRWPVRYGISSEAVAWSSRIAGLASDRIEVRNLIWKAGVRFLINGLEFARVTEGASLQIEFGVRERSPLLDGCFDGLKDLVKRILTFRDAYSPDRRHPLYRLRTEAWLEAQLRRDIRVLDPSLDPCAVYSQVPAWRGEERSVLDLLTIDARGRLVVIEIKAAEDMTLPLQGLDYWLSVEESRKRGEFERRGFFPGRNIADEPPVLWLVFPELRVHRSFRTISSAISSDIEVVRIAIGGDWRRQVRVRARERVNKGM